MPDYLAVVRNIIEAHQTIRRHVRLAGESVSDRESLNVIEQARSGWVPARLDILSEKLQKLQQTMSMLADGLNNHFRYEEEFLPPVFGEFLMRALLLEHEEVRRELAQAKQIVADASLEGLSREQLLATELKLQQVVNSVSHVIEDHAFREEVVLGMLERALENP